MRSVQNPAASAIVVEPQVNGVCLPMELDTGAAVSLVSQKTWKQYFPAGKLEKSDILLKTYSGEPLKVEGQAEVQVELPLLAAGKGPSLWGRNWLESIQLDWARINPFTGCML